MAGFALNRKVFLPINNVFELGRRGVRKELVALRGKDGGDEGEVAYLTMMCIRLLDKCMRSKKWLKKEK